MQRSGLGPAVVAAGLALAASPVSLAESPPHGAVDDRVEVLVVNIEAMVSDKKGAPVAGLTREDFEVLVDGEAVEVTNFFAAETPPGGVESPRVDTVVPLDGRRAPASGEAPWRLALYVDSSSVDLKQRNDALEQLREFLRGGVSPGDQILLAEATRTRFAPLHPFTDRLEVIEQGLDELAAATAFDRRSSEFREILREIEGFVVAGSGYARTSVTSRVQSLEARIRAYTSETHRDTLRAADNLQRLVDAVAGLEGRKAVLYLGGSLSLRPGDVLSTALTQALGRFPAKSTGEKPNTEMPTASIEDGSEQLRRIAEYASLRGVGLYAFAAGDPSGFSIGLSRGSLEAGAGLSVGREEAWAPGVSFSQRLNVRSALELLAETTGGLALGEGRSMASLLDRLAEDRLRYYSLGIEPPAGDAGELRRLEVRVRGRGRQVRHRRAFRAHSSDQDAASRTLSALLVGAGENPLEVHLEVGATRPAEGDLYSVPLAVQVPVAALAVEAKGSEHTGQVSIFLVTGDGALADGPVRKAVFPVALSNAQILDAMGQMVDYRLQLRMPGGPGRIAVGVRDDLDPRLSTATLDLTVGEAPGRSR